MNLFLNPSHSFANDISNYSSTKKKNIKQDRTFKAYILSKGEWHEGLISISNGVLSSYGFSSLEDRINTGGQLTGYFRGDERFVALNQNNKLAIEYNFTHYVDFNGYRAYIIAN